jgi:hypothetical protein
MSKKKPLAPRNGEVLHVLIVARISGCASQKEMSLEDQVDHAKEEIAEIFDGDVNFEVVATKGKGERRDRPELKEIEYMLRSYRFDVMVMEDVGRLIRGTEAVDLWGIAVDHGTRCLAPNDCLDSHDENWEQDLIGACGEHVGHNAHTSKRLKHKLTNRFKKGQGAVALPIAGYVKPEGAENYDDWRIDEAATPTIRQALALLRDTLNYSTVADYLNDVGFALGPYTRSEKWDGRMVRRYFANPLLGGKPGRGYRVSVKHHETGVRMSVANTESEPILLDYPHLAHVDFDELQEVNALLADSHAAYRRGRPAGVDPLARKPKSKTKFPGQHVHCRHCGRLFLWGGNGVTKNLMCGGPRDWQCWNTIAINGERTTTRVMELITSQLYALDGFDQWMREQIEASGDDGQIAQQEHELQQQVQKIDRQVANVTDAIAETGLTDSLRAKLNDLKAQRAKASHELRNLQLNKHQAPQLPHSSTELRQTLNAEFERLGAQSYAFGDLLRQLVPEIHVYLVRLCTGGMPVPRARVKLNLVGHVDHARFLPGLEDVASSWHTIDLFEAPTWVTLRDEVAALHRSGRTLKQIAQMVSEPLTVRTAKNAVELYRAMADQGLDDPYVMVDEPPMDLTKMKRHKNARYSFVSVAGYEPPPLT